MTTLEQNRQRLRKRLGLTGTQGTIASVGGSLTNSAGKYYVKVNGIIRTVAANGTFRPVENIPVVLRYDPALGEEVIHRQDPKVSVNSSVFTGNALDTQNQLPSSANALSDFRLSVYGSSATVSVLPLTSRVLWYGNVYQFPGASIDLTDDIPSTSSNYLICAIGWYPPLNKLYTSVSSETTDSDPGSSFIREAWDARTRNTIPAGYALLSGSKTTVAQTDLVSLRQFLNVPLPRWRVVVDAATYTVNVWDELLYVDYTTTGTVTLTLPSAADALAAGTTYVVYDVDGNAGTNNITVSRAGSDTIDGATSATISTNNGKLRLIAISGTEWITL
jgi:hypothetical protein